MTDDDHELALRTRLEAPVLEATVDALPRRFRHTVLEVRGQRPAGLEDGPWLAGALRGALGRALMDEEVRAVRPAAARLPNARSVLFDGHGQVTRALAVPKPFVPAVEVEGDSLRCRITLFGFADYWRDAVRRALLHAMGGLRLKEDGGICVPILVHDGHWWRAERVPVPELPERVRLVFEMPLCLRAAGPVKSDLCGLVFALLDRISGLARWQDTRLETDWSAWRRLADDLRFERVELRPISLDHRLSRQSHRHRIVGLLGGFDIVRPPAALMPLLALGEAAHAGAHAALGMGRYRLLVYP